MSIEILDCLKRKRDICVKAVITSQNTAFMLTPALTLESRNTVVTIPENLPLSDSEKSVLSKGLNFVPICKKLDEFLVK